MRIIAGTARGRRLKAPKGASTRPTPDRVKEALFSMLGPDLPGRRVLDLFAGTGALGLEALSRGASHATFVERDKQAHAVLTENIATVGATATRTLAMPAERAVEQLAREGARFDLVFLDPPFAAGLLDWALRTLLARGLILPPAVLVCEHSKDAQAPDAPEGCTRRETRGFGDVALSIYDAKG